MTFSLPVTATCVFVVRDAAGVEKSMSSSSALDLAGDRFRVLRCRNSSNDGMTLGGVKGIAGFKIDLIWIVASIYTVVSRAQRSDCSCRTFVAFPDVSLSASNPPGPRLLPRDFFFSSDCALSARCSPAMSVVALSLPAAMPFGMCAIDFRFEREVAAVDLSMLCAEGSSRAWLLLKVYDINVERQEAVTIVMHATE